MKGVQKPEEGTNLEVQHCRADSCCHVRYRHGRVADRMCGSRVQSLEVVRRLGDETVIYFDRLRIGCKCTRDHDGHS